MASANGRNREIVSIVRVEEQDTFTAARRAVSLLGGIEQIVPKGSRVLVKPNLVMAPMNRGITNPIVLDAVLRLVATCQPREIVVAEGAADVYTASSFRLLNTYDVASRYSALLVDLNLEPGVRHAVPEETGRGYVMVPSVMTECDVLISVPTYKLWGDSPMSLSLKNMFGLYGAAYYGHNKNSREYAREKPEYTLPGEVGAEQGVHAPTTSQSIVAMNCAVRPHLTIIDALEGGDGEGNSIRLDLLLAGRNSTAADTVALAMSSFVAADLQTWALAGQCGLGPNRLEEIEVKGERVEDVQLDLRRLQKNILELPLHECLRHLSLGELEAMARAMRVVGLVSEDVVGSNQEELTARLLLLLGAADYFGRALETLNQPARDLARLIAERGGTSGEFYTVASEFARQQGDDYVFWPAHRALTRLGLAYVFHGFAKSYFILPEGLASLLD